MIAGPVTDRAMRAAIEHRDFLDRKLKEQDARLRQMAQRWADGQGLRATPRIERIRQQVSA